MISIGALLDAAAAATARDELGVALAHLLDAWQRCPDPALADAITRIGARAQAGLEAPRGRKAQSDVAWHAAARAGDPVIRGVLLETLLDSYGLVEPRRRIERLTGPRQPKDPRTAATLADFVLNPVEDVESPSRAPRGPGPDNNRFWKAIFTVLPTLGDPRLVELLETAPAAWADNPKLSKEDRASLAKLLAGIRRALQSAYKGSPTLSPDERRRCAAVTAALRPADKTADDRRTEHELLAMLGPSAADEPRRIYADWLEQRGDPRGELIALQLARGRRGKPTPREGALIEMYRTRWLGPAIGMTKHPIELVRGTVTIPKRPDDDATRAIFDAAYRVVMREIAPRGRSVRRAEPVPDPERLAFAHDLVEELLRHRKVLATHGFDFEPALYAAFAKRWERALELANAAAKRSEDYARPMHLTHAVIASAVLGIAPSVQFPAGATYHSSYQADAVYRLLLLQSRELAARALDALPAAIAIELVHDTHWSSCKEPLQYLLLRKTQRDPVQYVAALVARLASEKTIASEAASNAACLCSDLQAHFDTPQLAAIRATALALYERAE